MVREPRPMPQLQLKTRVRMFQGEWQQREKIVSFAGLVYFSGLGFPNLGQRQDTHAEHPI